MSSDVINRMSPLQSAFSKREPSAAAFIPKSMGGPKFIKAFLYVPVKLFPLYMNEKLVLVRL